MRGPLSTVGMNLGVPDYMTDATWTSLHPRRPVDWWTQSLQTLGRSLQWGLPPGPEDLDTTVAVDSLNPVR